MIKNKTLFTFIAIVICSCTEQEIVTVDSTIKFKSFGFFKETNPRLNNDVFCSINDSIIEALVSINIC